MGYHDGSLKLKMLNKPGFYLREKIIMAVACAKILLADKSLLFKVNMLINIQYVVRKVYFVSLWFG